MEEWIVIGVLSTLVGVIGFFIGRVFQPKQNALRQTAQWWKDEVDSLRQEVKRYRARASYYQKGAVPSELGSIADPGQLINAVIDNLPANYRMMLAPFKSKIIEMLKEEPELAQHIPALIQRFLGNKPEEQNVIPNDSL